MPRPWSTYNVDVAVDATIATADPTKDYKEIEVLIDLEAAKNYIFLDWIK